MFKLKKLEIFLRIIKKKNKFCLEVENCCGMAQPSSLIYTQPSLVYGEMECCMSTTQCALLPIKKIQYKRK